MGFLNRRLVLILDSRGNTILFLQMAVPTQVRFSLTVGTAQHLVMLL